MQTSNRVKVHWTSHSEAKMRQYGLSKSRLLQIVRKPERKERGIAEGTTAVMQTRKTYVRLPARQVKSKLESLVKTPGEVWLMYRDSKGIRNIISAWRYPGISKPGDSLPIPEDIRQELQKYA